jgi:P pilus assembly chaperone PapD
MILSLLVGIGFAVPTAAIDVQPVVNVIDLPQEARGISFAISNPRNVDLPVTFDIVERDVAPDGSEQQNAADDNFVIFPLQATLKPGQTQSIRVQYVGPQPTTSRSFTLFATEVPVATDNVGSSGVQRILRIGATVHVAPAGTTPRPVLVSASPEGTGTRVSIRNDGTRFLYVDNIALQFASKTVEGEQLANIAGRTLIPPGKVRTFVVPETSGTPTLKLITPYL